MSSHRIQKVEREVHQIVAEFFARDLTFPASTLASVTRVEVSKDLRNARVFVSFLGAPEAEKEGYNIILDHSRELQLRLGSQLKTKFCPKLKFIKDSGFEHSAKVDGLLKQIKSED